jgi:hypothetical protein
VPTDQADRNPKATAVGRGNVRQLAIGEVATIDNQTTSGTAQLRARFDSADNKLFPPTACSPMSLSAQRN